MGDNEIYKHTWEWVQHNKEIEMNMHQLYNTAILWSAKLGHLTQVNDSMSRVWKSPVTHKNQIINVSCHKHEYKHERSCHTNECIFHENTCDWMCHATNPVSL